MPGVGMRDRLIGPAWAVLSVLTALVVSCGSAHAPSAPRSSAPSPFAAPAPPVAGSAGIGDPYFPLEGDGGYEVSAYDIHLRYDPSTDRIQGHTTITARASESLSRFDLDLRLPASAVTVNDQPAQRHCCMSDRSTRAGPTWPPRSRAAGLGCSVCHRSPRGLGEHDLLL